MVHRRLHILAVASFGAGLFLVLAPPGNADSTIAGVVVSVADGDTLRLQTDRTRLKVRLWGIDAPERAQPYGKASQISLGELCMRKSASVEVRDVDRYGRIIGVVTCEGTEANRTQLERGLAWVYRSFVPPGPELDDLVVMETQARAAGVGLWSEAEPVEPWTFRRVMRIEREIQAEER